MPNDPQNQINALKQRLESLEAEVYRNNFTETQDFNKTSRFNTRLKVPTYSSAPSKCEIGELYVDSDDGKLYVCTSANTWSLAGSQS